MCNIRAQLSPVLLPYYIDLGELQIRSGAGSKLRLQQAFKPSVGFSSVAAGRARWQPLVHLARKVDRYVCYSYIKKESFSQVAWSHIAASSIGCSDMYPERGVHFCPAWHLGICAPKAYFTGLLTYSGVEIQISLCGWCQGLTCLVVCTTFKRSAKLFLVC